MTSDVRSRCSAQVALLRVMRSDFQLMTLSHLGSLLMIHQQVFMTNVAAVGGTHYRAEKHPAGHQPSCCLRSALAPESNTTEHELRHILTG